MKNTLAHLRLPALIGFLLTLPFAILELVNRRNFHEGFPIPLFIILSLLPVVFILILLPVIQNIRAGESLKTHSITLLLRVIFLILTAWIWTGIVIDQMPCFLGAPNCD